MQVQLGIKNYSKEMRNHLKSNEFVFEIRWTLNGVSFLLNFIHSPIPVKPHIKKNYWGLCIFGYDGCWL